MINLQWKIVGFYNAWCISKVLEIGTKEWLNSKENLKWLSIIKCLLFHYYVMLGKTVNVALDRYYRMVKTNIREIKPLPSLESINALQCCSIFWVVVQIGNTFWHNFLRSNCTYQSFRSNCSCIQRWFIVSRGQHSNIMLFKQGQTETQILFHIFDLLVRKTERDWQFLAYKNQQKMFWSKEKMSIRT